MKGLAILCPGQGNQHPAMFDHLGGSQPAERVMETAAAVLGSHPVTYYRQLSTQDSFTNRPAQLLIATLQMATWATLQDQLPLPRVLLGYSMGELVAYGCAGSLSLAATLTLIERRATLMDEVSPHPAGLIAVRGLNRQGIEVLCRATSAETAIINGPDHFILGGPEEALRACESSPLAARATTLKRLQVSVPSHTRWLDEAGRNFAKELSCSALRAPAVPVLAGVSGAVVRTRDDAIQALSRQVSQPINWQACLRTAIEMGCGVFLELGPGNALSKMLQEMSADVKVRSVDDFRSLQGVADWAAKQLC